MSAAELPIVGFRLRARQGEARTGTSQGGIGTIAVVEGRVLIIAKRVQPHVFFADHEGIAGAIGDRSKAGSRVPALNHTGCRRTWHLPAGGGVGLPGRVLHLGLDQDAVGTNDKVSVGVAVAGRVVPKSSRNIDAGRCSGKWNLRDVVVFADAPGAPAGGTVIDGQLGLAN